MDTHTTVLASGLLSPQIALTVGYWLYIALCAWWHHDIDILSGLLALPTWGEFTSDKGLLILTKSQDASDLRHHDIDVTSLYVNWYLCVNWYLIIIESTPCSLASIRFGNFYEDVPMFMTSSGYFCEWKQFSSQNVLIKWFTCLV